MRCLRQYDDLEEKSTEEAERGTDASRLTLQVPPRLDRHRSTVHLLTVSNMSVSSEDEDGNEGMNRSDLIEDEVEVGNSSNSVDGHL